MLAWDELTSPRQAFYESLNLATFHEHLFRSVPNPHPYNIQQFCISFFPERVVIASVITTIEQKLRALSEEKESKI